ncbi:hypothetical protein POTOM_059434 [Populus tomentosa]|uniref:Tyrosine-protein phosphatase domain-containing protein n=1 Tax=Populus tomentosa TaxID=118781 RepID=A0A8X7XPH9_POPTO|nr:hypothetical protein POTOM_059434 [Populus tomentosa]
MARSCKVAVDSVNVNKKPALGCRTMAVLDPFKVIDHLREDIHKCKPHHGRDLLLSADFFIRKHFSVHSYTEDFWEMIIEHHCPVIVMLTRLVDNYETVKCGDYFQAEDGPRDFGNISIVTKWVKTTDTSLLLRSLDEGYKEVILGSKKPSDHVTDILKDAGVVSCKWRASVVENKGSGYWNCTLLAAGILSTSHFFETVIGQSPQWRSYENKHLPSEHIITTFSICLDGGKSFLRQRNRLCVFFIFSIPKGLIMEFPRTQMLSVKFSEEHIIRHPVLALRRKSFEFCNGMCFEVIFDLVMDSSQLSLLQTLFNFVHWEQYIFCYEAAIDELEDLISEMNS